MCNLLGFIVLWVRKFCTKPLSCLAPRYPTSLLTYCVFLFCGSSNTPILCLHLSNWLVLMVALQHPSVCPSIELIDTRCFYDNAQECISMYTRYTRKVALVGLGIRKLRLLGDTHSSFHTFSQFWCLTSDECFNLRYRPNLMANPEGSGTGVTEWIFLLKNIEQVLGIEPRSLGYRPSVLTTTLQPPVFFCCCSKAFEWICGTYNLDVLCV